MSKVRWDKFKAKHSDWDQQNLVFVPAHQSPGWNFPEQPCLLPCCLSGWSLGTKYCHCWRVAYRNTGACTQDNGALPVWRKLCSLTSSADLELLTQVFLLLAFFRVKSWADAFGGELYSIVTKYSGSLLLQKVGKTCEGSLCFVSAPLCLPRFPPGGE